MSKKNKLDQYYTKACLAQSYLDKIIEIYGNNHRFLEPSAGTGAFLREGLDMVAVDIEPKHPDVAKVDDFLTLGLPFDDYITVGNPPFTIDVQFFNHAAKFSNVIAFVIPRSWRKAGVINRLHSNFHLVHDEDCPEFSFILEDEDWDVSTCFQIWERREETREPIKFQGKFFEVVKEEEDWDFIMRFYGSRAGDILPSDYDGNRTTVRFIKSKIDDLQNHIKEIDWSVRKTNISSMPQINPIEVEQELEIRIEG